MLAALKSGYTLDGTAGSVVSIESALNHCITHIHVLIKICVLLFQLYLYNPTRQTGHLVLALIFLAVDSPSLQPRLTELTGRGFNSLSGSFT